MNDYREEYYQDVDGMYSQMRASGVLPPALPEPFVMNVPQRPAPDQSQQEGWFERWWPLVVILLIIFGFALVCMYGR